MRPWRECSSGTTFTKAAQGKATIGGEAGGDGRNTAGATSPSQYEAHYTVHGRNATFSVDAVVAQ
jgi:hypothetical protein